MTNVAFYPIAGCICEIKEGVFYWKHYRLGVSEDEARKELLAITRNPIERSLRRTLLQHNNIQQ